MNIGGSDALGSKEYPDHTLSCTMRMLNCHCACRMSHGQCSCDMVPLYCSVAGVLIAQPLLRQMKMTGAPSVLAKLTAAWKSPSEAAPSPKYTATHACLPSSCDTHLHVSVIKDNHQHICQVCHRFTSMRIKSVHPV